MCVQCQPRAAGHVLSWPKRGNEMQRVDEFTFYELATRIHPLTEIAGDINYADKWFALFHARDGLKVIFDQRPLGVSMGAANDLWYAINAIVPSDWNEALQKLGEKTVIPSFQIYSV